MTVASAQEKHLYGKGFDRVKKDAAVYGAKGLEPTAAVILTRWSDSLAAQAQGKVGSDWHYLHFTLLRLGAQGLQELLSQPNLLHP